MDSYIDENGYERINHDGVCITYFNSRYIDLYGKPVKKNRDDYRYSYDFYVQWRGGENVEGMSAVYSDRLLQQNWDKYNSLRMKYFGNEGQYWDGDDPKKVEAFLQDYMDDKSLKLIVIMEGCNVSSGFPLWTFHFTTNKE